MIKNANVDKAVSVQKTKIIIEHKRMKLVELVREDIADVRLAGCVATLLAVLTFICLGVFVAGKDGCPDNTYVYDGLCHDCLKPQPNCISCKEFGVCDECEKGYYYGAMQTFTGNFNRCLSCMPKFSKYTIHCNSTHALECQAGKSLYNGDCYDCSTLYDGAATCDATGALTCNKGYYLIKNETSGLRGCSKCSDVLDHCLECENSTTCDKCTQDFFVVKDGKCTCQGGLHVQYNQQTKSCECKSNFVRTTDGCRDIYDLLGRDCKIWDVSRDTES